MSDFTAKLTAQLDLSAAESQMNSFLSKYQNQPIKLKAELDTSGGDLLKGTDISKKMQSAGKAASQSFSKGLNAAKISPGLVDLKGFVQSEKEIKKYTNNLAKDIQNIDSNISDADANKLAQNYIKANKERLADEAKTAKEVEKIEADLAKKKEAANKKQTAAQQKQEKKNAADAEWWSKALYEKESAEKVAAEREAKKTTDQVNAIKKLASSGQFELNNAKADNFLSQYVGQDSAALERAKSQIEEIKSLQKELSSWKYMGSDGKTLTTDDLIPEDAIAKAQQLDDAMNKLGISMKTVGVESSKTLKAGVAEATGDKIQKYYENNTRAVKKYGDALKELESKARSATTEGEKADIDTQFSNLRAKISAEGLTGNSFFAELGKIGKQVGQYLGSYVGIERVISATANSVNDLKEMDSILTEISKTSDITSTQLKELGNESFEAASKYGQTANQYLLGVQEMNRSGYYGEQGQQMAELSVLTQAAGDVTSDVANSYLLATNAAYDYQGSVEDLNAVLDGQNSITNRNSVSMSDMADATSKAASMAAEMGVAEDELSAMIGTIESRTKAGGDEVGTALKSLLINLQDTSSDDIVATLENAGTSMTEFVDGSEKLRTPIQILKDLSETFTSLEESDPLRSEILTNIGGKYHAKVCVYVQKCA